MASKTILQEIRTGDVIWRLYVLSTSDVVRAEWVRVIPMKKAKKSTSRTASK